MKARPDRAGCRPEEADATDDRGDLPEGIYQARLDEVRQRLGITTNQRQRVFQQLFRIHRLAKETGQLERFIIFGSFVTIKADPNDVDILVVMRDDFELATCSGESRKLFYHDEAAIEFNASIFWIKPSMIVLDTLGDFISHWQIKRDLGRRGIVEVIE